MRARTIGTGSLLACLALALVGLLHPGEPHPAPDRPAEQQPDERGTRADTRQLLAVAHRRPDHRADRRDRPRRALRPPATGRA